MSAYRQISLLGYMFISFSFIRLLLYPVISFSYHFINSPAHQLISSSATLSGSGYHLSGCQVIRLSMYESISVLAHWCIAALVR